MYGPGHQGSHQTDGRGLGRRQLTAEPSPTCWAIDLSLMLNAVLGPNRFPVDVPELAREYSAKRYPDDPISLIQGEVLPGFDGALLRAPSGKKGWGIFFNRAPSSKGRINFTLAHEFGHYLIHRMANPDGIAAVTKTLSVGIPSTARSSIKRMYLPQIC